MKQVIGIAFFVLVGLFSCKKEPTPLEAAYSDVLKNLIVPQGQGHDSCDYFMKVDVLGKTWTFCDDVDNPKRALWVASKFMTPGPSFTIGRTGTTKFARQGAWINFPNSDYRPYEPHVEIHMPDFDLGRDPIEYLDSMFAIKHHHFMSASEVVVPDGVDRVEEALIRAGGGYLTGWKIVIMLPSNDTPTNKLFIESVMGEQDNSFLQIDESFKVDDGVQIQYYLEFSYQANLYHHPQYGKNGLFSQLKNGKFKGILTVYR